LFKDQELAALEARRESEALASFDPRAFPQSLTDSSWLGEPSSTRIEFEDEIILNLSSSDLDSELQSFDIRSSCESSVLLSTSSSSCGSELSAFDQRSVMTSSEEYFSYFVECREGDDEPRIASPSIAKQIQLDDSQTISIMDFSTGLMRIEYGPKIVSLAASEEVL